MSNFTSMGCRKLTYEYENEGLRKSETPLKKRVDYYPFGLTFNQQTREDTQDQNYGFQGQEHQKDLDLGWVQFKWRMHNPSIGRFFNVDPLADSYVHNSPYAFSENKVVAHVELEGLESVPFMKEARQFENSVKSFQKGIGDVKKAAGKFISSLFKEGDGSGDLPGGDNYTTKSGSDSSVKSGSKNPLGPSIEIDVLLEVIKKGDPGKFGGKTALSIPKALKKVGSIVDKVSGDANSDSKDSNSSSTSGSQPTDGIDPIKRSEADSVIRLYYGHL